MSNQRQILRTPTLVPRRYWELMTEWGWNDGPVRPMRAALFVRDGCWWLQYENGWEASTAHTAGRPRGFTRQEMIKYLESEKGTMT